MGAPLKIRVFIGQMIYLSEAPAATDAQNV
jgi:hypothetical protein